MSSKNNSTHDLHDIEHDRIDHYPGPLQEAEVAAQKAHLDGLTAEQAQAASGTVNLLHRYGNDGKDNIVLVPAPTADPQDPLNLPAWRRIALLVMLQIFASFGQSAVSAFATLEPFLTEEYEAAGKNDQDILNLSVMPTLTQGLSNIALVPLAMAVGRRPVYIFANVLMILACLLAANNHSYEQHLAYRLMMGMSVGVGQTLVPLMLKEVIFVHERGRWLAWSGAINSLFGLVWGMFIPNVVDQVGWRNLYYIDACILIAFFAAGIFLMPETKYNRTLEAHNGLGYGKSSQAEAVGGIESPDEKDKDFQLDDVSNGKLVQITKFTRPDVDNVHYKPRTWLTDLRPFQVKLDWFLAIKTWKNAFSMFLFPNVLLLCVLNWWYLTMTIVHSATYPRVMIAGEGWKRGDIGYVQAGAVLDIILTPILLGYFSDWLIKYFAHRRKGVHEPEVRLLAFIIPCIVGFTAMIMHGYHQANPKKVHWFIQFYIFGALNWAFGGTAIGTQIYLLECYPSRGASVLMTINTFRGAMAFAVMSNFMGIIMALGGAWPAWAKFGAIAAGLATVSVGTLFFFGKKIRLLTLRFVVDTDKEGKPIVGDS